jgi:LCP family protein required for cell wall assembly
MGINIADIKYQSDKRKKSDFDWVSILLILLAIGIVVGSIYFIFYFRESNVEQLLKSESILSSIIVENDGNKTQTLLLSFYNPKTNKQAAIVIPEKTRLKVEYEDKPSYDTIENIYFRGGIRILGETIERLTNTEFPFYVVYDLTDVEKLVDLLEGVEIIIPENMNYSNPEDRVFIKLSKGQSTLDGAKTKQFLQYRYGDAGMSALVENHRIIVESLLDRTTDIEALLQNAKIMSTLTKGVDTNFSRRDVMLLVEEMYKMNSSKLLFYRMYGKNITLKNEEYITPVENGIWLQDRIATVKKYISDEGLAPFGDEIKLEILNGSINPGQAQSLRNYFIQYGFNVVHYGNAMRNDYERTLVIDRIGRPSLAKRIADIINCKEVYTRIDKTLLVDVTIILGNDFEGKYVR